MSCVKGGICEHGGCSDCGRYSPSHKSYVETDKMKILQKQVETLQKEVKKLKRKKK